MSLDIPRKSTGELILEEDRWIDQYTLAYGYLPTKVLMENALGRRAISVMGRVYAKRGVLGLPREYSRWNGDAYLEFIKRNRLQDFWYREYWKEAEKERTRYKHRIHISKAPLEDQCDEVMPPPPPLTRSPSSRKLCLLSGDPLASAQSAARARTAGQMDKCVVPGLAGARNAKQSVY